MRGFFSIQTRTHTHSHTLQHTAWCNYRPDDKKTFWTARSDWTSSHGTRWTDPAPPSLLTKAEGFGSNKNTLPVVFRWLVCVLLFKSLKSNRRTSLIAIKRLCLSAFPFSCWSYGVPPPSDIPCGALAKCHALFKTCWGEWTLQGKAHPDPVMVLVDLKLTLFTLDALCKEVFGSLRARLQRSEIVWVMWHFSPRKPLPYNLIFEGTLHLKGPELRKNSRNWFSNKNIFG